MSQINVSIDALPPGALVFQHVIADVPGVVAANNYLSIFNPANSTKTIVTGGLVVAPYTSGASSTNASLQLFRTTAASGGTQILPQNITKYDTSKANSIADVRVGNPTVTLLTGGPPIAAFTPPLSTGTGAMGETVISPGGGINPTIRPGEGIVLTTSAGNINQMWNIQLIWIEF